jgi:hypothetical protein
MRNPKDLNLANLLTNPYTSQNSGEEMGITWTLQIQPLVHGGRKRFVLNSSLFLYS